MLVKIGQRTPHAPDDVVGPLLDCHARIRAFSTMALRLARGEGRPTEIADAAAGVERYFRIALPLHVADEELSLRPRLLDASPSAEVRRALDVMSEEHLAIEALLASLLPRWATLAADPSQRATLAAALVPDSDDLGRRFDAHLAEEERVIFPAVRAHLGAAATTIRAEMADRRRDG